MCKIKDDLIDVPVEDQEYDDGQGRSYDILDCEIYDYDEENN